MQRTRLLEAVVLLCDRGGDLVGGGFGVEGRDGVLGRGWSIGLGVERLKRAVAVLCGPLEGVGLRGQKSSPGLRRALGNCAVAWSLSIGEWLSRGGQVYPRGLRFVLSSWAGMLVVDAVAAAKKSGRAISCDRPQVPIT